MSSNSGLYLIRDSYTSLGTGFVSLKLCMGFSFSFPFRFYRFFKFIYFFSTESMDSFTLKRHNSFKMFKKIKLKLKLR